MNPGGAYTVAISCFVEPQVVTFSYALVCDLCR